MTAHVAWSNSSWNLTIKFPSRKNSVQIIFQYPGNLFVPCFSFKMIWKQFLFGQFTPNKILKMTFRNLQNRCFTGFQRTPSSVVISGSSYHVVRQPEESISILHTTGPPSQDEQTKLSPVFFACEDHSRKIHRPSQHLSVVLLMVQKSSGCTSWGTGSWNPMKSHYLPLF